MNNEPFDLTPYVKEFELSMETHLPDPGEGKCSFQPFKNFTGFTIVIKAPEIKDLPPADRESAVQMEVKGKYWFDRRVKTFVHMTKLEVKTDGNLTADYNGISFQDLTNYGRLARFLRWILRR